MKSLVFASLVLALSASVQAQQTIALHNAPQGVTSCTIPTQVTPHTIGTGICPLISFQTHWKPGNGSPVIDPPNSLLHDLAHTHIECNLPEEGEVGGPITVPCRFQAFHLDGAIALFYSLGQVTMFAIDAPFTWPVVGDPHGVVVVPFHLTFDPRQQFRNGDPGAQIIQDHGWANLVFGVRTYVNNGDTYDTQPQWTIWSMVTPASPIAKEGEGTRVQLATKSTAVSMRDTTAGSWGAHLIEFRNAIPMWAAMNVPNAADAFAYTYGAATTFSTSYQLVCANDYHNGNPGVEMTFVTAQLPVSGEPFNHDFVDPLKISQAPAIPGFPPNTSRCTFIWQEGTPDDHAIPDGRYPGLIAAGQQLFSLVSVDVAWTPNPVGCNASCSNAIGASPVTPTPPPVVPPVVVIPDPPPPPPPPPVHVIQPLGACNFSLVDGKLTAACN